MKATDRARQSQSEIDTITLVQRDEYVDKLFGRWDGNYEIREWGKIALGVIDDPKKTDK